MHCLQKLALSARWSSLLPMPVDASATILGTSLPPPPPALTLKSLPQFSKITSGLLAQKSCRSTRNSRSPLLVISAPTTKWQVIAGNQAKTPKATRKQGKAIKPPIGQFAGLHNQTEQCDTAQSIHRYCGPPAAWVLSYIVLASTQRHFCSTLAEKTTKSCAQLSFLPQGETYCSIIWYGASSMELLSCNHLRLPVP